MDIIRFVDSIAASPAVRLDLNDGITWGVNYNGTDFSPPPLKSAFSNTLLTDGERMAASAYANRTISLSMDLMPPSTTVSVLEDFEDASLAVTISGTWARDSTQASAGLWSFKSAAIGPSATTDAVVTVPAGASRMSLRYMVSSELNFDLFSIIIDGNTALVRSGVVGWTDFAAGVSPGTTVVFRYSKDSSTVAGLDAAFIDELSFYGPAQDAQAAELQKLWRELNRPTNILMYQPQGATNPVFFRTIRSSSTRVTDYPTGAMRTVDVSIDAEPFAYGLKEQLSASVVTFDPAVNMFFDVTSPKGDVETPLYLTFTGASVIRSTTPYTSLVAVRRRGTVGSTPFVVQAEAMTLTASTIQADANASGGNFVRTSIPPFAYTKYMHVSEHPATPSVDARGTYRVFMRYKYTDAGTSSTIKARVRWGGGTTGATNFINPEVLLNHDQQNYHVADLGLVQIPGGYDPVHDGISGVEVATKGIYFELQLSDGVGGSSLDVDYFIFAPADDRFLLIRWAVDTVAPTDMLLDSLTGQLLPRDASGRFDTRSTSSMAGGPPMISPGVTNRIYFGLNVAAAATGSSTAKTSTTTLTPHYWPRYLMVRPVSS